MTTLTTDDALKRSSPITDDLQARLARHSIEMRLFGGSRRPIHIGRYEVRGELGSGGMGIVFRAYDPELDREVALKLLRPEQSADSRNETARARLLREARAMARLNHPNVLTVHEVGTFEDQVFVAMEYVEGQTLAQWLAAEDRDWETIVRVFVDAGRALAAAHEAGIVHRDFKPQNVMVGATGQVRVLDFGLARGMETEHRSATWNPETPLVGPEITRTRALIGTPAYMAPEQYDGRPATPQSDQFSFCVALWEALYGTRPFHGDTIGAMALAVHSDAPHMPTGVARRPAWLRRSLERGLASDPATRHSSMLALLEALEQGLPQRSRASSRRGGSLVLGAWVLVAMIGAAAIGSSGALWGPRSATPLTVGLPTPELPPLGVPAAKRPTFAAKMLARTPKPDEPSRRAPRYDRRWCYHLEDSLVPLGAGGPHEQDPFDPTLDLAGACYECRRSWAPDRMRKQTGRPECAGFGKCQPCGA